MVKTQGDLVITGCITELLYVLNVWKWGRGLTSCEWEQPWARVLISGPFHGVGCCSPNWIAWPPKITFGTVHEWTPWIRLGAGRTSRCVPLSPTTERSRSSPPVMSLNKSTQARGSRRRLSQFTDLPIRLPRNWETSQGQTMLSKSCVFSYDFSLIVSPYIWWVTTWLLLFKILRKSRTRACF